MHDIAIVFVGGNLGGPADAIEAACMSVPSETTLKACNIYGVFASVEI